MTYVTDRHHLERVIQDGIGYLLDLQDGWLSDDADACAPTYGDSVGTPNPNATDDERLQARYRDRDRLGRAILKHVGALGALVHERKPRTPTSMCSCCRVRPATHPPGRDTDCWWCWKFLRRHGKRCDDEHHAMMPLQQLCECPPQCCPPPCTDHATEGVFSERCADQIRKAKVA